MVQDSAMLLLKETTNNDVFHSNSFGKVNTNFACFVIVFCPCCCFLMHNPTQCKCFTLPWAGRNSSSIKRDHFHNKSEQEIIQENQLVLIKFCLKQNEDMARKLFGTKNKEKSTQLGWQVGELESLWSASMRYVGKFDSGISSSCKDYQDTYKGGKKNESMWIHDFVILQLFHPKFLKIDKAKFLHNNYSSFVHRFTTDKVQEYTNIFEEFSKYVGKKC